MTTVTGRVTGLGQSISVSDEQGGSNRLIGLIETNAPLEPGDSGGPLLAGGRVIGLNAAASSIISYDGPREGYSIPINRAVSIAHQIESGRRSTTVHVGPTAFLGVLIEPPDYPDDSSGAIVQSVLSGSAAERAGIESGDVITRAGKPIRLSWTDSFGSTNTAVVRPAAGPPQ